MDKFTSRFFGAFLGTLLAQFLMGPILVHSAPPGMIYVRGGTFQMGCSGSQNDCEDDQKPVHTVTVSSFFMSVAEVTNAQFCEFLNSIGSDSIVKSGENMGKVMFIGWVWGVTKVGDSWRPQPGYENHPVVPISWYGATEYCKWRGGRLPTEAEWEYAARGGNAGKQTKYAGSNNIDSAAWYQLNSQDPKSPREDKLSTFPIKQKVPNELGFYDMSGNVWEWCEDWYKNDYYAQSANAINPVCNEGEKKMKVLRGGSWYTFANHTTVFARGWKAPEGYASPFGIRVVMDTTATDALHREGAAEAYGAVAVIKKSILTVTLPSSLGRYIGTLSLVNAKGMLVVGMKVDAAGGSKAYLNVPPVAKGLFFARIRTKDLNGRRFSASIPVTIR